MNLTRSQKTVEQSIQLQKAFQGRFTLITPPRNHDLRATPAAFWFAALAHQHAHVAFGCCIVSGFLYSQLQWRYNGGRLPVGSQCKTVLRLVHMDVTIQHHDGCGLQLQDHLPEMQHRAGQGVLRHNVRHLLYAAGHRSCIDVRHTSCAEIDLEGWETPISRGPIAAPRHLLSRPIHLGDRPSLPEVLVESCAKLLPQLRDFAGVLCGWYRCLCKVLQLLIAQQLLWCLQDTTIHFAEKPSYQRQDRPLLRLKQVT
mmetsp:Transcript_55738/g.88499  ORF Transcript_55738/g.88499 Transcript_55738/m.88499 type:complete len:256 (-) Transcript_55738:27-794(-)